MSISGPLDLLRELDRLENLRDPTRYGNRQFHRFQVRADVELRPMDPTEIQPEPLEAKLRDLSRAGAGFICQQPVAPGSTWHLALFLRGYMVGQQGIIVRYCRSVSENVYLVGAQFCIETGLMVMMGIEPARIDHGDLGDVGDAAPGTGEFVGPEDLP